jgi:predicted lipoprotein with Yx(FWY)xxD motif
LIKTHAALAALAVSGALAVAGCGSGNGNSYGSSGESTATTESAGGRYGSSAASGTASVAVASVGDLGKVLVDAEGFTLYYFEKDSNGKSACYGSCASAWPPLTTSGAPHANGGGDPSKLGTTKRTDGSVQVTYAGWPLYTYTADAKPGEDNGTDVDAFGAPWYPLHPDGEKAGE